MYNKQQILNNLSDFNLSMYEKLGKSELFLIELYAYNINLGEFFSFTKQCYKELKAIDYSDFIYNIIDSQIDFAIDDEFKKLDNINIEYNKKRNKKIFDNNNYLIDKKNTIDNIENMKEIKELLRVNILQ